MQKDVKGFLEELTKLTLAYGIKIGGCGCCGSPFLVPLDESEGIEINGLNYDELTWSEDECYKTKEPYKTEEVA